MPQPLDKTGLIKDEPDQQIGCVTVKRWRRTDGRLDHAELWGSPTWLRAIVKTERGIAGAAQKLI
ncbi:hypothetical protein [Dactylosporangium sp. CS-033363]|uniref:hypothetical protein n=1 Tax=Dactylosporangium sp. CS-033363 TaxID=3239935 RepID=UPI003D8FB384